jgi:hypothetical protein
MIAPLARLGYASKAVVYAIVGILAILAVFTRGGAITDTRGALRVVVTQPFGHALLIVLAIGLCSYGAWRLLDAFFDPDRDGTSTAGLITRIANAVRGLVYGALGFEAIRLLRGAGASSGDEAELFASRVFDWPLGTLIVGIAGLVVALYGLSELVKGVRGTDDHKVEWRSIAPNLQAGARRISRFGVAVRGGLLVTLGTFLVRAALTHDPNQAAGTRESFLQLGGLIEGRWFLALIACGVIAYAVDQAIHACCRRIRPVLS